MTSKVSCIECCKWKPQSKKCGILSYLSKKCVFSMVMPIKLLCFYNIIYMIYNMYCNIYYLVKDSPHSCHSQWCWWCWRCRRGWHQDWCCWYWLSRCEPTKPESGSLRRRLLKSEDPSLTTTEVNLLRSATVGEPAGLRDVVVVDVPHHLAITHCTLLASSLIRGNCLHWFHNKLQ